MDTTTRLAIFYLEHNDWTIRCFSEITFQEIEQEAHDAVKGLIKVITSQGIEYRQPGDIDYSKHEEAIHTEGFEAFVSKTTPLPKGWAIKPDLPLVAPEQMSLIDEVAS